MNAPAWMVSNHILHLVILPTEGCNCRCTYCYEDFRIGRMRPPVVLGLRRFLSRRAPELGQLDISWFGGEPLLAGNVVQEILEHVRGLRSEHRFSFTSGMTTNAVNLSPERLETLVSLGNTEFQITLDGTGGEHDRKRKLARGGGTFDRIWGNLTGASRSGSAFGILLRLHVDRSNEADIAVLLGMLGEAFAGDPRYSVLIRPLSRLGGPNDGDLAVLDPEGAVAVVARLRARAEELGLRPWSAGHDESVCYASRPNSLVIRADGRIGKCTVALKDPRNDVGRIREDGSLALDRERMLPWIRGLWSGTEGDLACPLKGLGPAA